MIYNVFVDSVVERLILHTNVKEKSQVVSFFISTTFVCFDFLYTDFIDLYLFKS